MPYAILRTAKISTMGQLAISGQHTFRERETPNADSSLTPKNIIGGPSSTSGLIEAVKARLSLVDEQAATTPVIAIEYLITASPDAFSRHGGALSDKSDYFRDAVAWLAERHGQENVVSRVLHLDERTPHMVAYVVPLVEREAKMRRRSVIVGKGEDGKPIRETREFAESAKRVLSAKHFLGGREKLREMQTDFAAKVGRKYGLERGIEGSRAQHQTIKDFYAQIEKPAQNITISPESAQPQMLKKGIISSEYETPEMVAKRLTKAVRQAYIPVVEGAKLAESERRRAQEMARTAKEVQKREDREKSRVATLEAEKRALVQAIKENGPELIKIRAELLSTEPQKSSKKLVSERSR